MIPQTHFEKLSAISDVIIADDTDFSNLYHSLHQMKSIFQEIAGIDPEHPEYIKDIHHDTGKAIGPRWAELCIDDLMRTKRFSKGTYHAILDTLAKKKGEPVVLLYVGTGPFATLVMHLTTKFKPEELQFIFVEVNPISLNYLKNCIANLGVEAYVKKFISIDATTLQLENAGEVDILLLECLQYALVREQQVALTYNLIPQLREDVILVPNEIKLSTCLLNSKLKMQHSLNQSDVPYYQNINTIFVLNKDEIQRRNRLLDSEKLLEFEPVTTQLTEDMNDYSRVCINTEINIYGDQKLGIDECSLTMNYKLSDVEEIKDKSAVITQYIVDKSPHFVVEWI